MAVAELRTRAMASEVVVLVDGDPSLLGRAESRIRELEARWSRFVPTSDISRLATASGHPVAIHEDTVVLLDHLVLAWHHSAGSFDPTVTAPGLRPGTHVSDMAGLLIDATAATATLPAGSTLDAGGLGKGLASDLVAIELVAQGAAGALVSIGGDLRAAGSAGPWSVAVEDPHRPDIERARFAIWDAGVATSSTRSRRWTRDGVEHHHVVDPRTGGSAVTDVHTVTVVAPESWQAEAFATRALILGAADGIDELEAHGLDGIVITAAGDVHATTRLGSARITEAV